MLTLHDLPTGAKATILSLNGDAPFKKRLYSFGIKPGCRIELTQKSIGNQNIEIVCQSGLLALRQSEAKQIIVEEIL